MSDDRNSVTAVIEASVPDRRHCTRCDDDQVLIANTHGMGKYECEGCELVVGFDLDAEPAEFLLGRGLPGNYTKHVFGTSLSASERRLP